MAGASTLSLGRSRSKPPRRRWSTRSPSSPAEAPGGIHTRARSSSPSTPEHSRNTVSTAPPAQPGSSRLARRISHPPTPITLTSSETTKPSHSRSSSPPSTHRRGSRVDWTPSPQRNVPSCADACRGAAQFLLSPMAPPTAPEQPPFAGYALQRMGPAIGEADSRSGHQILHGARHDDLIGAGVADHASGDVHGQTAQVVVADFALSGVEPDPDLDSQPAGVLYQLPAAADRPGGPVEEARAPSPSHFTRCPRKRSSWRATPVPCTSSSSRHCWSPSAAARSVDATMSVNSTVARTRSGSAPCGPR